ncbi:MAG: M20/M25/M40 family metallo-hydrolase [Gemmatimonadota bacterium]
MPSSTPTAFRLRFLPALAGLVLPFLPFPLHAQDAVSARVAGWMAENQHAVVDELVDFLRIPNVASDLPNVRRNADALVEMMEARGITARLLETGGPPMVFGERRAPGATTTLLFYAHYDGQPVDPAGWVDHDPFEPILRTGRFEDGAETIPFPTTDPYHPDWRIYARSASDDKMPILALMAALDALEAVGSAPNVNLKFLFEGDEEAGSPYLRSLIRDNLDLLSSDLVLMVDGPEHPSLVPTVVFGARGITSVQITLYGADRPLHSGHYGNWAPNPAHEMALLLASMKDGNGRVLIDGFYDDVRPMSAEEEAAIALVQDDAPSDFGFARPEGGAGVHRLERIGLPSLNVRGLSSGWVGADARTLVPDSAVAEIDLRLVPDVEPEVQVARLVDHVARQGFHVVSESPDRATRLAHPRIARVVSRPGGGYPAMRTSFDHPVARQVVEAVRRSTPVDPVLMPMMGGSVPAVWFPREAGTDVLLLPTVNPDNHQHAENENVRLGNVFRAVATLSAVMRSGS